jgi:hypothetical protein
MAAEGVPANDSENTTDDQAAQTNQTSAEPITKERSVTPPVSREEEEALKQSLKTYKGSLMFVQDGNAIENIVYLTYLSACPLAETLERKFAVGGVALPMLFEAFNTSGEMQAWSSLEEGKPAGPVTLLEILRNVRSDVYPLHRVGPITIDVRDKCSHFHAKLVGSADTLIFQGKLSVTEKNGKRVVNVLTGDIVSVGSTVGVFVGLLRGEHMDEFVVHTSTVGNETPKNPKTGKRSAVKIPVPRVLLVKEGDTAIIPLGTRAETDRLRAALEHTGQAIGCLDYETGALARERGRLKEQTVVLPANTEDIQRLREEVRNLQHDGVKSAMTRVLAAHKSEEHGSSRRAPKKEDEAEELQKRLELCQFPDGWKAKVEAMVVASEKVRTWHLTRGVLHRCVFSEAWHVMS